jgi:hypothetical protein
MDSRIGRPSPALIVAVIALAVALGGSAVALPGKGSVDKNDLEKNAVVSKAIKKNAVKAKHIRSGQVRADEIRDGEVGAAEIAPAEAFHRVGAPDEVQFTNGGEGDCVVQNGTISGIAGLNPASFYRDQTGIVYLVGVTAVADGPGGDGTCDPTDPGESEDAHLFTLPEGYRPENVQLAGVGSPAFIAPDEGITVPFGSYGGGAVVLSSPTPLLLDNTNFRAADAGTAPIENSAPARLGEAKLRGLGAGW